MYNFVNTIFIRVPTLKSTIKQSDKLLDVEELHNMLENCNINPILVVEEDNGLRTFGEIQSIATNSDGNLVATFYFTTATVTEDAQYSVRRTLVFHVGIDDPYITI